MLFIIQLLASFELSCVKVGIQNLLLLMHMWNLFLVEQLNEVFTV
jgi:hypothetical protein